MLDCSVGAEYTGSYPDSAPTEYSNHPQEPVYSAPTEQSSIISASASQNAPTTYQPIIHQQSSLQYSIASTNEAVSHLRILSNSSRAMDLLLSLRTTSNSSNNKNKNRAFKLPETYTEQSAIVAR